MATRPSRSIAAYERQLKAAQREADIERVTSLEKALVSFHKQSFPKAERVVLPPAEAVDPEPIRDELEREAGIPELIAQLGGNASPPVAPAPEPVDGYKLMREFRKRRREGISLWRLRDRIEAARQADREAEVAAKTEAEERKAAQEAEQARLNQLWEQLQQARTSVAEQLPGRVEAEKKQREAALAAEQEVLDREWERRLANDPEVTLPALQRAFADNEAPAAAVDCTGDRMTVVMHFSPPEAIVPERKPARTPTGKRTLKKRTKTEINALYLEALGSNALATVKEAFAVAPGAQFIQLLVVRRETGAKPDAIYFGEFSRQVHEAASGSRDPGKTLTLTPQSMLNLKGKTAQVAPLDLGERPDLNALLS
jgi:hypothetical protein